MGICIHSPAAKGGNLVLADILFSQFIMHLWYPSDDISADVGF